MRTKRNPIRYALFAVALLVAGIFASPAKAQSNYHGKFTLPYEVQWGTAVLPAGNYLLAFNRGIDGTMLVVTDANNRWNVAFEPINIREDSAKAHSELLITVLGREHVVKSLTIAELGQTFVYPASRKFERAAEEARATQKVSILVAKK